MSELGAHGLLGTTEAFGGLAHTEPCGAMRGHFRFGKSETEGVPQGIDRR